MYSCTIILCFAGQLSRRKRQWTAGDVSLCSVHTAKHLKATAYLPSQLDDWPEKQIDGGVVFHFSIGSWNSPQCLPSPSACVLVDSSGSSVGLTVYNLAPSFSFSQGDVVTVPDPCFRRTSVKYNVSIQALCAASCPGRSLPIFHCCMYIVKRWKLMGKGYIKGL